MPPKPMLRRNGTGTTTSASRLIATVTPEANTAWPAVFIATTTASSLLVPVRALLAPSRDHEQRVVDRDAEPDQRDEELHDEADVGERRQHEHQHERRQDRHRGDEQRQQGEERREHEQQHEQGAQRRRAASRPARRCHRCRRPRRAGRTTVRPLSKPAAAAALCSAGSSWLSMRRPDSRGDRRLDQRVRRPAVVGDEALVAGAREVDDAQLHVRNGRDGGGE